jgi:hypothetical protein
MENGIGSQLVQLQPVHKEQSTKEFVDRGRETTDEVVDETNPILDWGTGKLSSLGKINASFFFIRLSFIIRLAS